MLEILAIIVFNQINWYRVENQLLPLVYDQTACLIAEDRLEEIESNFSHEGFYKLKNGKDFFYENLSWVWSGDLLYKAGWTIKNWKTSPTHNAVLLSDSEIGCVKTDGERYVFEAIMVK